MQMTVGKVFNLKKWSITVDNREIGYIEWNSDYPHSFPWVIEDEDWAPKTGFADSYRSAVNQVRNYIGG